MTQLLEKAFQAAQALPETEQDALAANILADLEDERRWSETFARSPDILSALADEARAEYRAGRTLPLEIENR
jgi:hypothetical protein